MLTTTEKSIIIDPELSVRHQLSDGKHFVFRIDVNEADKLKNSFLVLRSTTLNQYAELVLRAMKDLRGLRVVFLIRDKKLDVDGFLDKVQELGAPTILSKLHLVTKPEQIQTVVEAWYRGEQHDQISHVTIDENDLIVKDCAMKSYRISFEKIPVLCHLSPSDRNKYKFDGNTISWAKGKVDLDMDVIRYECDLQFRRQKDLEALRLYGPTLTAKAIKNLREQYSLTQGEIATKAALSVRQVSRLETGNQKLNASAASRLAKAHGTDLDSYLGKLINTCAKIEGEQLSSY